MLSPCSRLPLLLGFVGVAVVSAAQLPKTDPSFDRFYRYPLVNGRSPAAPAMSPDGTKIVFGWNQTGIRKLDVWMMDYPSGRKRMIVDAAKIADLPRQDDERTDVEKKEQELYDGGIAGFRWAPDSRQVLFAYKGRTWLVKPDGGDLHPIVDGSSGMRSAEFTPDGGYISYIQGQNLFRLDRKSGAVKQLTFLSKANTSLDGFHWSPDGRKVFVQWSDDSKTGKHVMMDYSKDRSTVTNIRRSWNGDLDVNVKLGLIDANGGIIKWVPDLPTYMWIQGIEWSPDSQNVACSWIAGDFKSWTLSLIQSTRLDLKPFSVVKETAPANYVNDWRPIAWTRDSKRILYGTDLLDGKFANRSIVSILPDGKGYERVYAEKHDVGNFMRPKDSDRLILVTAARDPLTTEIRILEPDGKRTERVVMPDGYSTPKEFNSASDPLVSDDGRSIAAMASDRTINPELYSVEPTMKRLTESQLPDFKKVAWAKVERVSFPAPDGRAIHALLITNPSLDRTRRHPAVVSGIYADSAKSNWGGFFENYAAMNLDFVMLCVDFRSSWGYDGDFNSGYYQKMGLVDVDEAVAAKNYLASLPYVRGDRVGIWGWSYGGYLTCMALLTKPGAFYAGVAVAPVTDWKNYNEWYTRRRLGLVKDDKDKIFEKTSPITYANNLQDHLLLVHGMVDDNVLFQDTVRLTQKLIENGKPFDEMFYPRDDHGIGKDTSRPHVYSTIMRYLAEKLNMP